MIAATRAAAAVLAALAGCTLIDQSTFRPAPKPPAPAQVAQSATVEQRHALVTLRLDQADPQRAATLNTATRAAETRKPDVVFEVVAVLPVASTAYRQQLMLAQAQRDARTVMELLLARGVPETRVTLGLIVQDGGTPREVRVYVR